MSQIVLDISANTHKNNKDYLRKMIESIKEIDTGKHEIIFKHQLFLKAGDNIPLKQDVFDYGYYLAKDLGYQSTASVFDKPSLNYLLKHEILFVKIANRRDLDWLIDEVPRKIPIYLSFDSWFDEETEHWNTKYLSCISNYPSKTEDYEAQFPGIWLKEGISDHTVDFQLWRKYKPNIIEWHYKLEDSTGLDAGDFAKTPRQLAEVIG